MLYSIYYLVENISIQLAYPLNQLTAIWIISSCLPIIYKTAMNIHEQVSEWTKAFISLEQMSGIGIAGSYVSLFKLYSMKTAQKFY